MRRSALALLAVAAFGSRGIAQASPPRRLEVHPYSVAFTPGNAIDRARMSNVAIGGQASFAVRPGTNLVGSGLYVLGVDMQPEVRTRIMLYQVELGAQRMLSELAVAGRRISPFVGAGVTERLYDLASSGFPDAARVGGYASLGVRVGVSAASLAVEYRTYLFEGGVPPGAASANARIAHAVGVSVRFR
jgi:hypothetical protein